MIFLIRVYTHEKGYGGKNKVMRTKPRFKKISGIHHINVHQFNHLEKTENGCTNNQLSKRVA
jgi:hypothetical protein